ncbi:MAG TPA: tetratricopeptide repeat protein [Thermoanaerobaculia bacterium]|nr:tetratricopeptide repeat protein [Thermoanaerobaculia bacterium]
MPFLAALFLTIFHRAAPETAPTPLELGEKLLQQRQYAKAEVELRRAVEADPSSARAHGNLALALLPQRKVKDAVAEGRLAAAFGPNSPEAHFIYGLALSADGKTLEAARQYEQTLALKPDQARPLAALAAAYAAAEDPRTADTYRKLIALAPNDPRLRAELAEFLWRTQKTADGNDVMTKATRDFPSDADLLRRFGRALAEQERFEDAMKALEASRALAALDAATFALLGQVQVRAGQTGRALDTLEAGTAAFPSDPDLAHDLGRLLLAEGRVEESLPPLEKAARARPTSAVFQLDLGRALERTGKLEAAEAAYRRALALAPSLPGAHYSLGRLLQREGKKEEADQELAAHRALYERARQLAADAQVNDSEISRAWADLYAGKASEALARFKGLHETPESLTGQALALQRLGRNAEAEKALDRAHALAPDDARIELLLAAARSQASPP